MSIKIVEIVTAGPRGPRGASGNITAEWIAFKPTDFTSIGQVIKTTVGSITGISITKLAVGSYKVTVPAYAAEGIEGISIASTTLGNAYEGAGDDESIIVYMSDGKGRPVDTAHCTITMYTTTDSTGGISI
jgi:hypothetical protein